MSAMISDNDVLRVYLSLEVPKAISDLLDVHTVLEDEDFFSLEIALSEMTAENALLTLACVARNLSCFSELDEALTVSLALQADAAFDDYAPRYLAGMKQSMKSTCSGYSVYMQEDLEAFADIFSLVADLAGSHEALRDIATILSDQACAHAEAISVEDDLFDYDEAVDPEIAGTPEEFLAQSSNIILFPRLART